MLSVGNKIGLMHRQSDTKTRAEPVVSRPESASWFQTIPGEQFAVRVHGSQVQGKFTIVDSVAQPMSGPPLHYHREDETFHILEGTVTFACGDERFDAGPGTIVHVPAGEHHAWFNFTNEPARMRVTFAPGGIERNIFMKLAGAAPHELAQIAAEHGTFIVGGPLTR